MYFAQECMYRIFVNVSRNVRTMYNVQYFGTVYSVLWLIASLIRDVLRLIVSLVRDVLWLIASLICDVLWLIVSLVRDVLWWWRSLVTTGHHLLWPDLLWCCPDARQVSQQWKNPIFPYHCLWGNKEISLLWFKQRAIEKWLLFVHMIPKPCHGAEPCDGGGFKTSIVTLISYKNRYLCKMVIMIPHGSIQWRTPDFSREKGFFR